METERDGRTWKISRKTAAGHGPCHVPGAGSQGPDLGASVEVKVLHLPILRPYGCKGAGLESGVKGQGLAWGAH